MLQAQRSVSSAQTDAPDGTAPRIVVSVVSHGQSGLVKALIEDIRSGWRHAPLHLVLTENLPEATPTGLDSLPFPVTVIRNLRPKGFAENQNTAFEVAESDYFCVLNPDIRTPSDPLPALLAALAESGVGLTAPRVVSPGGRTEDSARRRITPLRILRRVLGGSGGADYDFGGQSIQPDWVAGMFMLLRSPAFRAVGGFDTRYRLYCEDADLCLRLWAAGWRVQLRPEVEAVHDARRQSHSDSRYLRWHLTSLLRFFVRHPVDRREQT